MNQELNAFAKVKAILRRIKNKILKNIKKFHKNAKIFICNISNALKMFLIKIYSKII
jgi:hypothetical protein